MTHDLTAKAAEVDPDATERVLEQWGKDAIDSREAANQFDAIIHRGSVNYAEIETPAEAGQVRETEGARPDNRAGAQLSSDRLPAETRQPTQPDLIGGVTDTQQALHREELARDAARNRGQESAETGRPDDLFSQARKQVDIDDRESNALREDHAVKEPTGATGRRADGLPQQLELLVPANRPAPNPARYSRLVKNVEVSRLPTGISQVRSAQDVGHLMASPKERTECHLREHIFTHYLRRSIEALPDADRSAVIQQLQQLYTEPTQVAANIALYR